MARQPAVASSPTGPSFLMQRYKVAGQIPASSNVGSGVVASNEGQEQDWVQWCILASNRVEEERYHFRSAIRQRGQRKGQP